jgi:dihydrofolate synthase/folylpolyglutamate synthase
MDTQTLSETRYETDVDSAYRDALSWLFSFATYQHKTADAYRASKLNLERIRAILAGLGNPHEKFQSVHVAGTKGKGSTAAMCESVLRASGVRTGLYTSPHLHTFRERIRLNGELISRQKVVEGIDRLRKVPDQHPDVLVFELITALAFDYFARSGVEFAVIEVGLGGRLDATNVTTPRVSIITSISLDHMAILGNTLAQIASEKAGIIKPRVPVISAPQREEAGQVIAQIAKERGAPLIAVGQSLEFKIQKSNFTIHAIEHTLDYQRLEIRQSPPPGLQTPISRLELHLLGAHQLANASTAIAAMYELMAQGIQITDETIHQGIERTRWPGRFEILERRPFLIVDGAHNRDSTRQLVATINALFPKATVQWVFGASDDKDVRGMFSELLPRSAEIILTRANHPRASAPETLATLAIEFGAHEVTAKDTADALRLSRERMDCFDLTVITGSLFIVAEARGLVLQQHGEQVESDE